MFSKGVQYGHKKASQYVRLFSVTASGFKPETFPLCSGMLYSVELRRKDEIFLKGV
jgi:hypothetical protein